MTRLPVVSVIVPAFNEESLLAANLVEIDAHCNEQSLPYELIVVDDGSVDTTGAIAEAFARGREHVRVITHPANVGLGGALRSGINAAAAAIVVTLDADLTYAPDHVERLLSACVGGAVIVIASPYAPGGQVSGVPAHRLALSRWANRLLRRRFGVATSTSMVRAYDREFASRALVALTDDDVSLGLIATARAEGRGVVEVPAHLDWRRVPDRASRMQTRASIRAVLRAWRARL
jgi:glycosyltransferase involved in cell wall biosynthesis